MVTCAGSSVLISDNIGTAHDAVADYMPDEPRYMCWAKAMAPLDDPGLVA